jgi:acetolactate synthase-1/3 small subunit
VVDSTVESFVFEVTGSSGKLDAFVKLMAPLGLVELTRTGVAAIARGAAAIKSQGLIREPAECASITTMMPM